MQEEINKISENESSLSKLKTNIDSKIEKINASETDQHKIESLDNIQDFAKDTLNIAEERSKALNSFISQMTTNTTYGNSIDEDIQNLKNELNILDPAKIDFSNTKNGFLVFFNPVNKYFSTISKREELVKNVLQKLEADQNILKNDNITLGIEINKIKEVIDELKKELEIGEAYLNSNITLDLDKRDIIEKKIYNIKQLIIINNQSILAMNIILKNNNELIDNVDRIKTVTLNSLSIAVLVANSIYKQKLVLKEIDLIRNETNNINTKSSEYLSNNTLDMASNVSIDTLKKSFEDTFDMISKISQIDNENSEKVEKEILEIKINNESEKNNEK